LPKRARPGAQTAQAARASAPAARMTLPSFSLNQIKLFCGDFLEEFYYNWIGELQSDYRDLYLEAQKELIAYHADRASANTDDTDRSGRDDSRPLDLPDCMNASIKLRWTSSW
jgi:hypothetical protein